MGRNTTILCVDQHQVLLDTLAAILPRFGFSTFVAHNLDDAFAMLASRPIDAVLLDYNLCPSCADLDGTDHPYSAVKPDAGCFARRLHSIRPQAKIFVWCADGSCLKDPPPCADAVFLKPMQPEDLAAQLHSGIAS